MKKTLTFNLAPISVEIDAPEGMSEKELRELGEKEMIKQFAKKYKINSWSLSEGSILASEDIHIGRPVKLKSNGKLGIIYDLKPTTKFPIRVLTEGNIDMQCTQAGVEKVSKRTNIDKLITGRQEFEKNLGWLSPRSGYFVNGKEIIPVIIVPKGKSAKAYIVGHEANGGHYTLSSMQLNRVFDTKTEAEEYVAKLK
ncbi:hypothetical protein [Robertmurraya sp. FSL R5-0851]|uniref:hypothetical protein n=1 Tax=Robertmurraya sp. FSL R5-0851 TaxID=2921584 RepID=UPI0030F8F01C